MSDMNLYRVEKAIGRGSYGEVVAATRISDGLSVAIKRPISGGDESARTRLRREIEALRKVQHAHVMPLLDSALDASWYVMPRANGILSNMRNTFHTHEVRVALLQSLLEGLAVAHQFGYTHRDINPKNILRLNDGVGSRWVLADWGIVRLAHGETTRQVTRQDGHALGTAGWAAPELNDANTAHAAVASSDVYSIGCLAAWLETGATPRENISPSIPSTSQLFTFVRRCGDTNPTRRPQTAAAALAMLANAVGPVNVVDSLERVIADMRVGRMADVLDRLRALTETSVRAQYLALDTSEKEWFLVELLHSLPSLINYSDKRYGLHISRVLLKSLVVLDDKMETFRRCLGALFALEPRLDQWSDRETISFMGGLPTAGVAVVVSELTADSTAAAWYTMLARDQFEVERFPLALRQVLS